MSKKESRSSEHKRDVLLIALTLVTIVSCAVSVWAVMSMRNHPVGKDELEPVAEEFEEEAASEPEPEPEPLTDRIALPQFAWLTFVAGQKEQDLTFSNPTQNFAWMRVSIVLDGTTLWESELLEPGQTSKAVVLSQALEVGEYDGRLVYSCFDNDVSMRPLNGADSPITIKVK